ncbi:hypothetical protein EHF36_07945 [Kerstersia gyiorum]|uniref:hypothetical protein n=1 Tax=Kerstersia gyiorum TaxID=206506 RepID=UPI0010712F88|nr:hypothetical protein [Kerstersia gyiorum]QBR40566.1 hypothetical protein EHF36_07945 [Kerstersia gyiorum]
MKKTRVSPRHHAVILKAKEAGLCLDRKGRAWHLYGNGVDIMATSLDLFKRQDFRAYRARIGEDANNNFHSH